MLWNICASATAPGKKGNSTEKRGKHTLTVCVVVVVVEGKREMVSRLLIG